MHWFVLITKSKQEKKVTLQLQNLGFNVYCPLVTEYHQWSDRKKKVEVPLITSYLFINIQEKNRDQVFEVPGIVRYLFWLGKPAIVKDEEIKLLKSWLSQEVDRVLVENINPGDLMNIKTGPFKGLNGIVEQVNKNRIRLLLPHIGMKITIKRKKKLIAELV